MVAAVVMVPVVAGSAGAAAAAAAEGGHGLLYALPGFQGLERKLQVPMLRGMCVQPPQIEEQTTPQEEAQ